MSAKQLEDVREVINEKIPDYNYDLQIMYKPKHDNCDYSILAGSFGGNSEKL